MEGDCHHLGEGGYPGPGGSGRGGEKYITYFEGRSNSIMCC